MAILAGPYLFAQTVNIGLKNEPTGSTNIQVYLRTNSNRAGTASLSSLVFTVRWPANANLDLSATSGSFGVNKAGLPITPGNGFEYQKFSSDAFTVLPADWQTTNDVLWIASFTSLPGVETVQNPGVFRGSNLFIIDPAPAI